MVNDPFLPHPAEIVEVRRETPGVYTYRLRFRDEGLRRGYRFLPGQFNMVYVFGVGEVAISIVSDPDDPELLDHTIRIVGNVTGALERLKEGDTIGLRGPYGSAWPLKEAEGKEVIVVTGGLGCAPVVSVINYIAQRREQYGKLKILHGVKTPKDLLYRERFRAWERHPNTEVYLTVDHPDKAWKYNVGVVTNLFDQVEIDPRHSIAMMCGPEIMMRYTARSLLSRGIAADRIYVSLERNMKCAIAFCGHCQLGPTFVCREGPVYRYDRIQPWFETREI
ncbi:MAG: FAD/NAD(P)-binding protein [Candidatus Manganitrophus sp.]|nr:FAD/NAD(P)-binding protein [Candidatus Manganitrophus sp.]MDC4226691.1 FAD/NAD(P)-binding protein [Candidatus Manganitrophus sp.]WDT72151.1 MAG: FAD/NAD(P)-binding protein [Candidatus Manganitrophus sp.]